MGAACVMPWLFDYVPGTQLMYAVLRGALLLRAFEGEVALGGRIPVNVSGGLLSKGHPLGATGIANIYEVSTHLRNEAGARQVQGAKIGLTHVIGLGSACAIHVLERA